MTTEKNYLITAIAIRLSNFGLSVATVEKDCITLRRKTDVQLLKILKNIKIAKVVK